MPGQIDPVDLHVGAPADDEIKHRERNWNAEPPLDDVAQERVFRVIVVPRVAAKSEIFRHEGGESLESFASRASLCDARAQPPAPQVELAPQFRDRRFRCKTKSQKPPG